MGGSFTNILWDCNDKFINFLSIQMTIENNKKNWFGNDSRLFKFAYGNNISSANFNLIKLKKKNQAI